MNFIEKLKKFNDSLIKENARLSKIYSSLIAEAKEAGCDVEEDCNECDKQIADVEANEAEENIPECGNVDAAMNANPPIEFDESDCCEEQKDGDNKKDVIPDDEFFANECDKAEKDADKVVDEACKEKDKECCEEEKLITVSDYEAGNVDEDEKLITVTQYLANNEMMEEACKDKECCEEEKLITVSDLEEKPTTDNLITVTDYLANNEMMEEACKNKECCEEEKLITVSDYEAGNVDEDEKLITVTQYLANNEMMEEATSDISKGEDIDEMVPAEDFFKDSEDELKEEEKELDEIDQKEMMTKDEFEKPVEIPPVDDKAKVDVAKKEVALESLKSFKKHK